MCEKHKPCDCDVCDIERDGLNAEITDLKRQLDGLDDDLKEEQTAHDKALAVERAKFEEMRVENLIAGRDKARAKVQDQARAISSLNARVTKVRGQRDEMKQERDIVTADRNGLRADFKHATALAESVGKQRDACVALLPDKYKAKLANPIQGKSATLTVYDDLTKPAPVDAVDVAIISEVERIENERDRAASRLEESRRLIDELTAKKPRFVAKVRASLTISDLFAMAETTPFDLEAIKASASRMVVGVDKASGSGDLTCTVKARIDEDGAIAIEEIEHSDRPIEPYTRELTPSEKLRGVTVTQGQIDAIESHLRLHSDRFNAIEKKVGENELSLKVAKKAIDHNVSYAVTRLDHHSQQFATKKSVSDVELNGLRERVDIDRCADWLQELEKRVTGLRGEIGTVNERFKRLNKIGEQHQDDLHYQEKQIHFLKSCITPLMAAAESDEGKLDKALTDAEWCRVEIIEGNKTKARHTGRLDVIERGMKKLEEETKWLDGAVDSDRERLATLEAEKIEHLRFINNQDLAHKALGDTVRLLDKGLGELEKKVERQLTDNGTEITMSGIAKRLDSLARQSQEDGEDIHSLEQRAGVFVDMETLDAKWREFNERLDEHEARLNKNVID